MDLGKIQALHFSLKKVSDLANKLLGARYRGINYQEEMDPHKKLMHQLTEELRLCEENLDDLAGELSTHDNAKSSSGKPISVRAHKRVKSKKPRNPEDTPEDPAKPENAEEVNKTALEDDESSTEEQTRSALDFGRTVDQHLGTGK